MKTTTKDILSLNNKIKNQKENNSTHLIQGHLLYKLAGTKTFKICIQVGGKWNGMAPRVSQV